MKTRLISFFYFSRKERLGVAVLLLLCLALFAVPSFYNWLLPHERSDFSEFEAAIQAYRRSCAASAPVDGGFEFDPNLADKAELMRLGLSEKVAGSICKFREKGGSFQRPEDFKKIWSLSPEDYERLLPFIRIGGRQADADRSVVLQPFDPNSAGESELLQLGLPARAVQSILHYREKGGRFKEKSDLARIYSLSESDFQRIAPYIRIAATAVDSLYPKAWAGVGYKKVKGPVDLNAADQETLMGLPMVGEKRAAQIIHFREKLGGFVSVDQLSEMFNLPDSVYQRIRPLLVVDNKAGAVHKINLNTASVEALDAHPYLSKKQAELIAAFRSQHGLFQRPEDILQIKAFTDHAWWDKVAPYLSVD